MLTLEQQSEVLRLARLFIRAALQQRPVELPADTHAMLRQPAGCFVSLHTLEQNRLRGCVGRIDATFPFLEALRSAATHVLQDPRFVTDPVRFEELPRLAIDVSVLSPARPAAHALDFEPLEHGIYLTCLGRAGCFLPQVARETGWSREQLLDRLCIEKMGLSEGHWRHPQARLHIFSVQVVGPERFESAGLEGAESAAIALKWKTSS